MVGLGGHAHGGGGATGASSQAASSAGYLKQEAGGGRKHKVEIDPRISSKILELRRKAKEHLGRKEFEESLGCLDIAIDLHASSYKLYRLRSIALACLHEYERAAADAERVVELAPHLMDGYYHKGFALYHLKQYAAAARAFQDGLKLNPTDRTLRQGFWDAVSLVSQSRTDSQQVADEASARPSGVQRVGGGAAEGTFNLRDGLA